MKTEITYSLDTTRLNSTEENNIKSKKIILYEKNKIKKAIITSTCSSIFVFLLSRRNYNMGFDF